VRLFLDRRFKQNAIQFAAPEGADPKPEGEDIDWMKAHGWRWRNEERVWTKQLNKDSEQSPFARANSDRVAEDEFVTLANLIRQRKGMEPVEYSFSQDRSASR
jgi:hypothetical protein